MTNEYLDAYRTFEKVMNESKTKVIRRLEPGECLGKVFLVQFFLLILVFNNRRMLHGRNEFKLNGGVRHLEGKIT